MEETAPRSELVNPSEKLNASPSATKNNNKPRLWSPKAAAASLGLEEDSFKVLLIGPTAYLISIM